MSLLTAQNIDVDTNLRCKRIYPVEGSKKTIDELKTVGIHLTREQAINLARVLLLVSQDWEHIYITGFRLRKRESDETYQVTVTGNQENLDVE